ncbi:MAG TPA: GNAT family N-acetyltransferase [Kofleriaceae bacterium]|nr:GNAT family N-acetyltransferase [Kofleriaceae bacterium]
MGVPKRRATKKLAAPAKKPARQKKARNGAGKKRDGAGKKRSRLEPPVISVRRIHRRDLNRVWEFLKLSFAKVNLETVEYQRPRSMKRFMRTYDEEGIDQLVFEVDGDIVAYAECAHEVIGNDNWINENYFERRKMEPLFVEELAVHPNWNGRGVGSFVMQQLEHLAKVRGLSHIVLEVAENNEHATQWYRKRGFRKIDAAMFMSLAIDTEDELLPPMRVTPPKPTPEGEELAAGDDTAGSTEG